MSSESVEFQLEQDDLASQSVRCAQRPLLAKTFEVTQHPCLDEFEIVAEC